MMAEAQEGTSRNRALFKEVTHYHLHLYSSDHTKPKLYIYFFQYQSY